MSGMQGNSRQKIALSLALIAISLVILWFFNASTPDGLWVGIYSYYAPAWGLLWLTAIGLIVYVTRNPLPWTHYSLILVGFTTAAGSISAIWGVPIHAHDPWVHLGIIRFEYFSISENPYPAYHILVTALSTATGLDAQHWLTVSGILAAILAVLFSILLARRIPGPIGEKQAALLGMLPALFLGFAARPVSLAWAFFPIVYLGIYGWGIESIWPTSSSRLKRLFVVLMIGVSPIFHPQLLFLIIILLGVLLAFSWTARRLPINDRLTNRMGLGESPVFPLVFAVFLLAVYLFVFSGRGLSMLASVITMVVGPVEQSASQPSTGTSILAGLTTIGGLIEAGLRLAFISIVGFVVLVGTISQLRGEAIDTRFAISWTASAGAAAGFGVLFLFTSLLGLERILVILPLMAFPAAIIAISRRPRWVAIALAVLCVTAGLATVYSSPLKGESGISTNERQNAAGAWLADHHNNQQIVPSSSTHWILRAHLPTEQVWALEYHPPPDSNYRYQWQIRGVDGLYVTDGTTRARLNQYLAEGGDSQVEAEFEDLHDSRNQVYSNGDTSVYRPGLNESRRDTIAPS